MLKWDNMTSCVSTISNLRHGLSNGNVILLLSCFLANDRASQDLPFLFLINFPVSFDNNVIFLGSIRLQSLQPFSLIFKGLFFVLLLSICRFCYFHVSRATIFFFLVQRSFAFTSFDFYDQFSLFISFLPFFGSYKQFSFFSSLQTIFLFPFHFFDS